MDQPEDANLSVPLSSPPRSPSMVQTLGESINIPALVATRRHSKPNKSWDGSPNPNGVSFKVVGVGRELIWRFNEHGGAINSFRNEPVANLQVGDMLVMINDVIVEGLPKDQVMKLWKSQKGMSESTTLYFRRGTVDSTDEVFPQPE